MESVPVNSTNLVEVRYEEETGTLEIDFKDGKTYQYYDVPRFAFDGLIAAESKGRYAAANIYKTYRQQRIR